MYLQSVHPLKLLSLTSQIFMFYHNYSERHAKHGMVVLKQLLALRNCIVST